MPASGLRAAFALYETLVRRLNSLFAALAAALVLVVVCVIVLAIVTAAMSFDSPAAAESVDTRAAKPRVLCLNYKTDRF